MAAGNEFFMDLELAAAMDRAVAGNYNYFNLASSGLGGGVSAAQFFPINPAAQAHAGSAAHGGHGAMAAPATFGFGFGGGALPVAAVAAPAPPLPPPAAAEDVEQLKGTWTKEEDDMLKAAVNQHGERKWALIAKHLPGRIGKQCRERWINHLHPDIKKDPWSEAEDLELVNAHKICGNKWSVIARRLPGRSENNVKNHWNATRRGLNAKRSLKKRSSERQPAPGRLSYLAHYIKTIHPPPPSSTAASLSPPPPPEQENEEQQLQAPQVDAVEEEQDPAAGNGENSGSPTGMLGDEFSYYFTHMQVPQQQVQQRQMMNYNISYNNVYPLLTAEDYQMGLNRTYAQQQVAQDRGSSSNNARLDGVLMGNNAVGGGGFSSYGYGGGVGPSSVAGQEVNVAQFAAEPGQYQVFNLEDHLTRFPSI
ncbi:transcription factor MYB73-like [Brachypodium distachyon]|uniref:Uncharacterized protein n=1 Tax=Brachypodium distachyon TaxID=15368 RepID=A0A0Q3J3W1_BRADI|nr:transcription factor MYB73-like [Brachypodium distachyon]KQK07436.1 hypothetical protein BRADI_2g35463v3 [Brachypodium distachyon]|eukprot:XP_024314583.1 transcription factor MYB73-like [Brachypodium distachyon]